jgi:glycerol-3-phosphate dehydrogenase
VHGFHRQAGLFGPLASYGSDAIGITDLMRADPRAGQPLHAALPICGAQVTWAARHEMARTLDDVLARRTRALYLNARAALEMAPAVARLLAAELKRDERWQRQELTAFKEIAAGFMVNP